MDEGLNVFDLLDGRSIVFASEDAGAVVTWNGSLTLQFWSVDRDRFVEYHVVTLAEVPARDAVGAVAEERFWALAREEAGDE